jgi:hypothetical protein
MKFIGLLLDAECSTREIVDATSVESEGFSQKENLLWENPLPICIFLYLHYVTVWYTPDYSTRRTLPLAASEVFVFRQPDPDRGSFLALRGHPNPAIEGHLKTGHE